MKFRLPEVLIGSLLTVAVFAIGMVFSSQYFPPPKSERPQYQQADGGQRKTETKDNTGQPGPTPSQSAGEDHGSKGGSQAGGKSWSKIFVDHLPDWFVALFTFVLSVFTGLLWHSTNKLWRAGERQIDVAMIAANAADRSARAAIALQLPVIRIAPNALSHGSGLAEGKSYENCAVHFVTISNLGTTKAFPKEILYGWAIGTDLPPEPSYQWTDSFLPNYILEPDPKATPRKFLVGVKMLEPGQWEEISKGNYLWFYCALLYDDFMGEAHSHGFCWRWSYLGDGFGWRIDGAAAYNRQT